MTIYLLLSASQPGPEAVWTLETWHGSRPAPSVSLDSWGASAGAEPRVAQATAQCFLAGQGVAVQGWRPCGDGPMYLAWVRGTDAGGTDAVGDR